MSQLHRQSKKRKHDDMPRVSQNEKECVPAAATSPSPNNNRFSKQHPLPDKQHAQYMRQRLLHQQLSRVRKASLPNPPSTPSQIAGYKEATVSNEWHREWQATSHSLVPSRPLSLLFEPTDINLESHRRKAKRAYLGHFDVDNEPEGRIVQRLKEQERQKKMVEQHLEHEREVVMAKEKQLERDRKEVRRAVQGAEVIDLTDDGVDHFGTARSVWNVADAENMPPTQEAGAWGISDSPFYQNHTYGQATFWNLLPYYLGHEQPAPRPAFEGPQANRSFEILPQHQFSEQTLHGYQDYRFQ